MVIGTEPPRATITFVPPSVKVKSEPMTIRLSVCVLVTPPEAVTVSAYAPATFPATAVKVSVLLPVPGDAMLAGENFAVTPVGRPVTDSVIADLNQLITAVLYVIAVELPAVTVALVALAVNEKLGTITVRLIICVLVKPPPVPFTVRVDAPPIALDAAFSVRTLDPFPGDAMLDGAKLAVTPLGIPVADNAIADLNPFSAAVETLTIVELPAATVALVVAVFAVKEKLGAATVTAIEAVRARSPPLPVMVTEAVPATAFAAAAKVTVTGAVAVNVDEENFMVTPAGAPLADKETAELNPPCAVRVIVAVAVLPGATEIDAAFGLSTKFAVLSLAQ